VHAEIIEAPLRIAPAGEEESELAPEIITYVKALLERVAGDRARVGGFVVTTTLDPALQTAARQAVRTGLGQYAERQKVVPPFVDQKKKLWGKPFQGSPERHKIYVGAVESVDDTGGTIQVRVGDTVGRVDLAHEERYNPARLLPSQFTKPGALLRVSVQGDPKAGPLPQLRLELGPQAALVAIEPRTRHVLALVGSHEALAGGLDRASHAKRQPGSAFKPFVYSYALHSRRFTPASVLELSDKTGATRRVSVREAIAKSDNAGAERLLEESGPRNVVEWAKALGIESPMQPTRSLALGAYEVRPLELANAYATFASGGEFAPAVLVTKIVAPDGRELPLPPQPPKRRVMTTDEAYLITSLMRSVVETGTAKRARALKWPVVGKTGTTNDAKDAWFSGFSTDLVATVWVGYDDALPLGGGEAGGATALPAWVEFMQAAHKGRPATEFARPGSIVVARVDPATGLLPYAGQDAAVEEEFLDGTVPTQTAAADAGFLADAGSVASLDPPAEPAPAPAAPAEPAPAPAPAPAEPKPDAGVLVAAPDDPPPF
jgi:penicillin-binding protein 1A